jgi:hypothetical protein
MLGELEVTVPQHRKQKMVITNVPKNTAVDNLEPKTLNFI